MSKPIEFTTSRANPKLWTLGGYGVLINVGSSIITNVSLVGDVENGGGCAYMEQRVYGKSLYLPQLGCEPKLVLKKNKVFKIK